MSGGRAARVALVALAAHVALGAAFSGTARAQFRYPSTCGSGCASNSAFYDEGGRDWACGGIFYGGHGGTDYAMGYGREIVAAANGVVTRTADGYWDGCRTGDCSGTNMVTVVQDDGITTEYLHMQTWSVAVSVGQRVSCGQLLGRVGSSGRSTGNHLHFQYWPPGTGYYARSDPYAGPCSRTGRSQWRDQGSYGRYEFPSMECAEPDDDRDGSPRRLDCDDQDARRTPGRPEACDLIDQDCDDRIDEAVVRACGTDVGECSTGTERCENGGFQACEGAVDPRPERCNERDDDCDGATDEASICELEAAQVGATGQGASDPTDLDGDGRADLCGRDGDGFSCVLSDAPRFEVRVPGPAGVAWADAGVSESLRLGDVDGDGRADLCTLVGERVRCWRSTGVGFGARVLDAPAPAGGLLALGDLDGDGAREVCVRGRSGLSCVRTRDGLRVELPALSDAGGFSEVRHFGTLRLADVDGDGRDDVCARDAAGVTCIRSEGTHFGARFVGPRWSDASGWGALAYWSTIHALDVDGDHRADLCARGPDGFVCHLSTGSGFGRGRSAGRLVADAAWSARSVHTTLRMGDVDGDGRLDVCVRGPDGVGCMLWSGEGFTRGLRGPALSDAAGWAQEGRFRTLRLADLDGDHRADLCAAGAEGLECHLSHRGAPFGWPVRVSAWPDAGRDDAWAGSFRVGSGPSVLPRDDGLVGGCAVGRPKGARSMGWGVTAAMLTMGATLVRRGRRRGARAAG